jgi:hypothetical protein
LGWFRFREVLPAIHIPFVDYITLTLAIVLLIAGILAMFGWRFAAPIALGATLGLWIDFVPGIWDDITGSMRFEMLLGRSTTRTWQTIVYQVAAMSCSGVLTYLRFWRRAL